MIAINVTQEDIGKGFRCNGKQCPVALALTRAGITYQTVLSKFVLDYNYKVIASFPQYVTENIRAFDQGQKIYPFTFQIKLKETNAKSNPVA